MIDMQTVYRLSNDIQRLGDTPAQIAHTLGQLGIKGRRKSPCDCPIARYLKSKGFQEVNVSGEIMVKEGRITMSAIVFNFISNFDWGGIYPELEDKSW